MYTPQEEAAGACVMLGVIHAKGSTSAASRMASLQRPTSHHIGGLPVVFGKQDSMATALDPPEMMKLLPSLCAVCEKPMNLLCQLHTPMDGLVRVLYVFSCADPSCHQATPSGAGGSWRVLRWQCTVDPAPVSEGSGGYIAAASDGPSEKIPQEPDAAASAWGANDTDGDWANMAAGGEDGDWAMDAQSDSDFDGFGEVESGATSSAPQLPNTADSDQGSARTVVPDSGAAQAQLVEVPLPDHLASVLPQYRSMIVDVIPEPYDSEADYYASKIPKEDLVALQRAAVSSSSDRSDTGGQMGGGASAATKAKTKKKSNAGFSGEGYESTPAAYKYFMKFSQRLDRHRRQCIRYAFDGRPLWCVAQQIFLIVHQPLITYADVVLLKFRHVRLRSHVVYVANEYNQALRPERCAASALPTLWKGSQV